MHTSLYRFEIFLWMTGLQLFFSNPELSVKQKACPSLYCPRDFLPGQPGAVVLVFFKDNF